MDYLMSMRLSQDSFENTCPVGAECVQFFAQRHHALV